MTKYGTKELELLNIQIGCVLKLERLKKGISQEDLGLLIEADKTKIARLERYAHATNWSTIYLVSQELNCNFCSLFVLKGKKEILQIVEECIKLENKLSAMKIKYYENLKKHIENYK